MPHHTKKKKRRHTSVRKSKFSARPTLKNNGFRIVRHNAPSMGVRRSTNVVHRAISNMIRNQNIQRPVYKYSSKSRKSNNLKSGRVENELLKQAKKMQKEREKQERNNRRSLKASKAASINNMNAMFSKMQM